MNLHPLLLSVTVVEVLGVAALASGAPACVRVVVSWREGDPSREQLSLERKVELASATGRLGLALHAIGWGLALLAINHVLPSIVPGAMCGYGALQALPGGRVMLLVRAVSLLALVVWLEVDRANRATPTGALTVSAARALLVAAPIAAVSAWQTIDAIAHVDVQTPVSCCAAVFDLARSPGTRGGLPVAGAGAVVATVAGGAILAVAALALRRRGATSRPVREVLLAISSLVWGGIALWTLVDVAAPYVYGVVGHRCPFCLMLPSHGAVGYVAYGALGVVVVDAVRAAAATWAGAQGAASREFGVRTSRSSLARVAVSVAIFLAVAFGPALLWRIREGVWITG